MLASLGALLAAACAGPGGDAPPAPLERATGNLALFLENDLLHGNDDEYTSGAGVRWTSGELERGAGGLASVVDALDFLPQFDDPARARQLTFTFGQEMYTPTDIQSPVPPPGQHPYAGVLFLDTAVHSRGERSLHTWALRLGIVGPSSGAEQVQEAVHRLLDLPIAQGWDTQLEDEFLINLDYGYRWRLLQLGSPASWGHDLTLGAGAGVGNYFIGADSGVLARLGLRLPATFDVPSLRGNGGGLVGLASRPSTPWWGYAFAGARVLGVARFLPTDGNTFEDGPSAERDDVFGNLSAGLTLGWGRLQLVYTLNDLGGRDQLRDDSASDYGTLALSWSL